VQTTPWPHPCQLRPCSRQSALVDERDQARPRRNLRLLERCRESRRKVADANLAGFFGSIPHTELIGESAVGRKSSDIAGCSPISVVADPGLRALAESGRVPILPAVRPEELPDRNHAPTRVVPLLLTPTLPFAATTPNGRDGEKFRTPHSRRCQGNAGNRTNLIRRVLSSWSDGPSLVRRSLRTAIGRRPPHTLERPRAQGASHQSRWRRLADEPDWDHRGERQPDPEPPRRCAPGPRPGAGEY
jgi:hypothetical protein